MGARNIAIGGIVLVQPWVQLQSARSGTPVAHEIERDAEERDDLDAGVHHALVGDVADQLRRGARGLDVGPDAVALGAEGEGEEGRAWKCQQLFNFIRGRKKVGEEAES